MRILTLTSLALGVTCALLSATAAAQSHPYSSAAGNYSIVFPGPIEESVDTTALEDGRILTLHMASHAPNDNVVYLASWTGMQGIVPDEASIKNLLENSRDGSASSMGATDVKTLALDTTGSRPFIEFTFASEAMVGKERIYFVNKTQYALMTIFAGTKDVPRSADEFIRSFKLADRPKK